MKKVLSLIICLLLVVGLVACGNNKDADSSIIDGGEILDVTEIENDNKDYVFGDEDDGDSSDSSNVGDIDIPDDVKYQSENLKVILDYKSNDWNYTFSSNDFTELQGKIKDVLSCQTAIDRVVLEDSIAYIGYDYTDLTKKWMYVDTDKFDTVVYDHLDNVFATTLGDKVTIHLIAVFDLEHYSLEAPCTKDELLTISSESGDYEATIYYLRDGVVYRQECHFPSNKWYEPMDVKCEVDGVIYPVSDLIQGNGKHVIIDGTAYYTGIMYYKYDDHIKLVAQDGKKYENISKVIELANRDRLFIASDDNKHIYCEPVLGSGEDADNWKNGMGLLTLPENYTIDDIDEIYLSLESVFTVKMKDNAHFYIYGYLPGQNKTEELIPVEGANEIVSSGHVVRVLPLWGDTIFLMDDGYFYEYVN